MWSMNHCSESKENKKLKGGSRLHSWGEAWMEEVVGTVNIWAESRGGGCALKERLKAPENFASFSFVKGQPVDDL